jgi:predicted Zn-dependent protease
MPDTAHRREALEELQRIEDSATLTDDDLVLLIQVHLELGDWNAARSDLVTLTARRHDDLRALGMAIREYLAHNEDLQDPEKWLAQLKLDYPSDPSTRELDLRMIAAAGGEDEALERLRRWADGLDETAPGIEKPAINFARIAESLGDWFERRKDIEKAQPFWSEAERLYRREEPRSDDHRLQLVQFLIRRRRLEEAASLLAQTGEQVPLSQFVATATQIAYLSGGTADSCRASRRLIDSRCNVATTNDPDALFSVASLAQLEGNFVEAESLCRRVLAIDPHSIAACNDLAFLLSLREDRHAEAIELIDRALTTGGRAGWVLDTQATVLRRAGKTDKALAIMQELTAENGTPTRLYHLAQALRDCGREQEARISFQAAIESGLAEASLHPLERDEFREMKRRFRPASIEASRRRARRGVSVVIDVNEVNSLNSESNRQAAMIA